MKKKTLTKHTHKHKFERIVIQRPEFIKEKLVCKCGTVFKELHMGYMEDEF